ncbi:hypothetical protein AciM339_1490 [Aciduliprofundum sp. MAR08-339]|uniref:hypothetical protein n=1 Tax=Aciduliprofundum sp. (strain MAR08-339) TaxID=673860 RepID=UPI0002A4A0AE|nr:hypothetical protein AciM339_1490 [Aciduliprofundum sp. MAR08-339]
MINGAQIILASSSLPFIAYGAFLIHGGEKVEGAYSIIGGIYTFIAIIMIPQGFPGAYVFPVSIALSGIGGFHGYAVSRKKMKLAKGILLISIAVGILLMQEVL